MDTCRRGYLFLRQMLSAHEASALQSHLFATWGSGEDAHGCLTLLPLLPKDVAATRRAVFGPQGKALGDLDAVIAALDAAVADGTLPDRARVERFAAKLAKVKDPFYRRVGEHLVDQLVQHDPALARPPARAGRGAKRDVEHAAAGG